MVELIYTRTRVLSSILHQKKETQITNYMTIKIVSFKGKTLETCKV